MSGENFLTLTEEFQESPQTPENHFILKLKNQRQKKNYLKAEMAKDKQRNNSKMNSYLSKRNEGSQKTMERNLSDVGRK